MKSQTLLKQNSSFSYTQDLLAVVAAVLAILARVLAVAAVLASVLAHVRAILAGGHSIPRPKLLIHLNSSS